jgi:hypothetical protein
MNIKRFPLVSALTDLPIVSDLVACTHDATLLVREKTSHRLSDPVILDIQESLPLLTASLVNSRQQPLDPVFVSKFHHATVINNRIVITSDGAVVPEFRDQAAIHSRMPNVKSEAGGEFVEIPWCELKRVVAGVSVLFFFTPGSGNNHPHLLVQTLP